MALLQRWEQENYETSVKDISTQEYKQMVNDVRDMLWPYRDKIQDVGNIYTYVPFAKSISAQDTELHCDIRYSDGQLSMMFKNTYMDFRDQMFEVHVSKKLFGLHTESSFDDELYDFSPEYIKTTIKHVIDSYTKEEKAEMFREANLKSLPDTLLYDISMAEHCQMLSLDDIRSNIKWGDSAYVTYLNGGKWDITQAHDYRCWASECETLKNSDGKIAVFDSYDAAANVLNIMVPGQHIKPTYVELVPKPLTVRTCKSMTEVADSITKDLETSQDFKNGLDDLNNLTMEI